MSSLRVRWRALVAPLAVLSLVFFSLLPSLALAQSGGVATGHAQVVAQGVDLMPRVPVVWRLTESEAAPADEARFHSRTLGFTVGDGEPILVTADAHTLLHDGQAAFHREGARERRSSTTGDPVEYLAIDLIVADAADAPESIGSSRLVFVGEEFRAPRGHRDLQLMRDVLAPSEEGAIDIDGDAPSLLYVTAGALQVTAANGAVTELEAGDALELDGPVELLAGAGDGDGATWLLAAIGDEVDLPASTAPEPDAGTGALELRLEGCEGDLDADCAPVTNRDVTVPAFHLIEDDGAWIIPDRAELSDDDSTLTYDDLPAGDYVTMPDEEAVPEYQIDGATWDDDLQGWTFEIEAGETTDLTLRTVIEVDDRGDTGSLLVTLYDCPAGSDPAEDPSPCDQASEPWDVSVADIGQSDLTEWTLEADALDLGDSQYWFELLPARVLTFYPDGAREPGVSEVVVTGDPILLGNLWSIEIPYHGAAEASLYRMAPGDEPPETGSLFLGQLTCPEGTDESDFSPCENASDPWDIQLEHVDTGETFSSLVDGRAEQNGQAYFPELPVGTYTLSGVNPSGDGMAYVDGDIETGGDWPNVTIEAGGEHIAYVYFVPADAADEPDTPDAPVGGIGSLVIAQVDCPYGVDPAVDASACATSTDPWAMTVTNDATGVSWDLLFEGVAYDAGTYVLESLPAGSYSVFVSANADWTLSYPTSIDVSADDETYLTVYSVDLRDL